MKCNYIVNGTMEIGPEIKIEDVINIFKNSNFFHNIDVKPLPQCHAIQFDGTTQVIDKFGHDFESFYKKITPYTVAGGVTFEYRNLSDTYDIFEHEYTTDGWLEYDSEVQIVFEEEGTPLLSEDFESQIVRETIEGNIDVSSINLEKLTEDTLNEISNIDGINKHLFPNHVVNIAKMLLDEAEDGEYDIDGPELN